MDDPAAMRAVGTVRTVQDERPHGQRVTRLGAHQPGAPVPDQARLVRLGDAAEPVASRHDAERAGSLVRQIQMQPQRHHLLQNLDRRQHMRHAPLFQPAVKVRHLGTFGDRDRQVLMSPDRPVTARAALVEQDLANRPPFPSSREQRPQPRRHRQCRQLRQSGQQIAHAGRATGRAQDFEVRVQPRDLTRRQDPGWSRTPSRSRTSTGTAPKNVSRRSPSSACGSHVRPSCAADCR